MIKTIIFDLDGTLLNTLEDLMISTNYALLEFGFPTHSLEDIRKFVGNGVKKLIERAVPIDCPQDVTEKCLDVFKEHYSKNMYNHTKPYDSILEILKELHNKGLKIGVVSNKFDSAVKELCQKYFLNLVDIAIGQSDDVPKKPAPNGVFKAMKELSAEPSSTIYVGDSEVDVQTAKNSNLPCIGVLWGFRDRKDLAGADYIIDNPCDILKIVEGE